MNKEATKLEQTIGMLHFCLGEEELHLQVFENPPSCGNDQRCKRKKAQHLAGEMAYKISRS